MKTVPKKLLMAGPFLKALSEAGLVPERCQRIYITAELGEAVQIEWFGFADERLLSLAEVPEARSEKESRV